MNWYKSTETLNRHEIKVLLNHKNNYLWHCFQSIFWWVIQLNLGKQCLNWNLDMLHNVLSSLMYNVHLGLAILKALWLNSYNLQCSLMSFIGNGIPHSSAFNHQLEPWKCNVKTVDRKSLFLLPVNLHVSLLEGELSDLFTRTGQVKSKCVRLCTKWYFLCFTVLLFWSYLRFRLEISGKNLP